MGNTSLALTLSNTSVAAQAVARRRPLGILVIALRVLAAGLALYNLTWSASGATALMRGHMRPPEIFLSFGFWMAVAVLAFHASYIFGQNDWWRLFAMPCWQARWG
ncbi:hypothetical protein [Sphingomonas sp. IW22]|uniref:hypothetical protein n=1 Tax=Sphingomonas sp. IW22 TaxID=3242489 RepID=UPI00351F9E3D